VIREGFLAGGWVGSFCVAKFGSQYNLGLPAALRRLLAASLNSRHDQLSALLTLLSFCMT
ncbi:hypothetical protein TorRG33x02_160860, partial [Trema orientale]